jgi:uncharacterized membrane protein YesL
VDRAFFRWICVVAGIVLAVLWLVAVLTGGPVLDWVPPSSVVALGAALAL